MAKKHYDHPIPARIMHHTHLVSMIVLASTGFFIHKPNFSLAGIDMNMARFLHFVFGFVILLNSVTRVYWAIFGTPRDIKYFMPEKKNRGKLFPYMAYYYFLRKTKPATSKYNGWQKSTYVIWTIAVWFMALTGFAMLWKTDPFWASVVAAFGGLSMIHAIHYLVMWFFMFTILFHVYLSVFEDFKSVLQMFFGIKPEEA
ncbi:MAG: cytochrome b/b6 domain-containing protein [bacterium]|nr:cytochrome b/b6 domain-containing protein [bacterium]MDT8395218.1 cytochrome b/b6 domain-containing protein [bacterium]